MSDQQCRTRKCYVCYGKVSSRATNDNRRHNCVSLGEALCGELPDECWQLQHHRYVLDILGTITACQQKGKLSDIAHQRRVELANMVLSATETGQLDKKTFFEGATGFSSRQIKGFLDALRANYPTVRQLLGADFSAGELAQARQRLGAGAELSLCRAQQLPFATASIDQVLCHMALMLMDELDAVLVEVLRVLVPAGRLAFVVGARPPPQPVYEHYIQRLLAWRAADPSRMLNFGERRLRDEASIHALLSPQFRAIEVNTITLHRRRTPAQVWDWVEGMYDLHLAPPDQCLALKADFMADLQALCEADGCVPQTDVLNRVVATAA